jgi:hypothetical protein
MSDETHGEAAGPFDVDEMQMQPEPEAIYVTEMDGVGCAWVVFVLGGAMVFDSIVLVAAHIL